MRRCAVWAVAAGLAGAPVPAAADWLEIEMRAGGGDAAAPVGRIEAVDSWFTTLATLMFEVEGLPPGAYAVVMLEQEDCERAAEGRPYRRPGEPPDSVPAGAFGDFVVAPDGATTRTLSVKPEFLSHPDGRLTVTEMRGHALVFRGGAGASPGATTVAACGVIPLADEAGDASG